MGRTPCCDADANVKKGPWTIEEDEKLKKYIEENGAGNWRNLPKLAGLNRCGKSCRLRWANYLRPDIKRGRFSEEEEQLIIHFHSSIGNKWSAIAARLPGRTDNEIKNYWNTHLRKKLLKMGIDPVTHRPRTDLNLLADIPNLIAAAANLSNFATNPFLNALHLQKMQLLQNLVQVMMTSNTSPQNLDAMSLLGSPFLNGQNLMALQNLQNNLLDASMQMPNLSMIGGAREMVGAGATTNSYMTTPTATPTATPENSIADRVHETVNSSNVSVSSPTSKPFEAWDGLKLEDLDTDLGWKDILNQISWSDEM